MTAAYERGGRAEGPPWCLSSSSQEDAANMEVGLGFGVVYRRQEDIEINFYQFVLFGYVASLDMILSTVIITE